MWKWMYPVIDRVYSLHIDPPNWNPALGIF